VISKHTFQIKNVNARTKKLKIIKNTDYKKHEISWLFYTITMAKKKHKVPRTLYSSCFQSRLGADLTKSNYKTLVSSSDPQRNSKVPSLGFLSKKQTKPRAKHPQHLSQ
jgi:hypothetical protein